MSGFSFVQITDHHLLESEDAMRDGFSPAYSLRMVMRHISEHVASKIDFIVSTGDLVEPELETHYQSAAKLLGVNSSATLPGPQHINIEGLKDFPFYFLPGNHDDRALVTKYFFPESQSPKLYNFSFEHKGVQFVFMDWGPRSKAHFFPETREFLANVLKAEMPSVIVCHQHVKRIGSRWLDAFLAENLNGFWDVVLPRQDNVLGILCGHVHITYEDEYRGVPIYGLSSTAFPFAKVDEPLVILAPPHYRYVRIEDGVMTTRIYKVPI